MRHYHHSGSIMGEQDGVSAFFQALLALPPNFFAITMGLAGLAGIWQMTGKFYKWPAPISGTLYLTAATAYLLLLLAFGCKLIFSRKMLVADLTHPILAPFNSLLPISGMLLALGLDPYAHRTALGLFLVFLVATLLLGGWMFGRWITVSHNPDSLHPGYYLPTVAGGLIGGEGLDHFGLTGVGWACFGIGLLSWLLLGSIISNRLLTRPGLPQALMPTIAIEMAPPALVGNAYLTLSGGKVDWLSFLFVGYTLLMILVQLCLLPTYRRLPFVMSFWSFTFPAVAAAGYIIRWAYQAHLTGIAFTGLALLTIVTLLIGSIALRSIVALRHSRFLPTLAAS